MRSFTEYLLRNRLLVHYVTLSILAFGLFGLVSLRREARPEVNFDRIAITVPYNGASAEDVEELILKPLEEKIDELDGIEEYRSTAFEGVGSMSIKIDADYSEKREVIDEVQRAVDQIRSFPSDVEDPVVLEIKASKITVYSFALVGDVDELTLREQAEDLKDKLINLEGVSSVDTGNLKDLEYRIQVSPEKLKNRSLSVFEIMQTLTNWNRVSPGGEIDSEGKNYSIRFDEQLKTPKDILDLTIRSNDAGLGIKIGDVGSVKLKNKEVKQELLVDGLPAVSLSVIKDESADIIQVVNRVKGFLEKQEFPDKMSIEVYYDDSTRIKARLKSVIFNALFGLILVLLSLTLFVSTRLAIVTSIGIPVAFLGGVGLIYLLGLTLNSLVVLGMIVVLGMLVDDAIVVAENIYSYVEKGEKPFDAAVKGVSEVASPVVATVSTTIFAFLPVAYMAGIMGQFLRVIPITVIVILFFSLFEALFILPSHCVELLKQKEDKEVNKKSFFDKLRDKYVAYVNWTVKTGFHVLFMVLVFVGVLSATAVIGIPIVKNIVLFPAEGIEFLSVNAKLPQNSTLDKTKEVAAKLAQALKESEMSKDIFSISTNVGSATAGGLSGVREQGTHLSQTTLRLSTDPDFIKREKKVIKKIKELVASLEKETGAKLSTRVERPGPPVEGDIQVQVSSRRFDKSQAAINEIKEALSKTEGIINLQTDLQNKSEYFRVKVDKALAVENGLSFDNLTKVVFSAFYGVPATTTRIGDNEVDIVVSLDSKSRKDISNLKDLLFLNNRGSLVPLKSFASIEKQKSIPSIQRLNGSRTITLFGDVEPAKISAPEANAILKKSLVEIKPKHSSVNIEVKGSDKQRMDSLKDTGKLYLFSLMGIFIAISLSFNSIGFPFMVLFAVPFGLIGVVWALFLHDKPLSLMGMVGVVGLSGVVVNSSIILIQFFLEKYRSGAEVKDAILDAVGRRFRPVVITSITTLLGLAPTIYSIGGNSDPFVQPLALALGWGLMVSTILTLMLLPSYVYGVMRYAKGLKIAGGFMFCAITFLVIFRFIF